MASIVVHEPGKHRHLATHSGHTAANVFDTTNKHATKSALCLPMICLIEVLAKHLIQIANSGTRAAKNIWQSLV